MFDVFGMLYSPGEFIRRFQTRPIRLKVPFLIVMAVALTEAVSSFLAGGKWLDHLSDQVPKNVGNLEEGLKTLRVGLVLNDTFGAVEFPLTWVIGTGVLTCMSVLLEGEAEFRKLLEMTGYTHLAPLIFNCVSVLFALTWHPQFTIDAPYLQAHPDVFVDAVNKAIRHEMVSSNLIYLMILRWSFLLWMGVLQVRALKVLGRLSYAKSAACMGGFVALYGLSQLIRNLVAPGGI